jgi:hypothetical protein
MRIEALRAAATIEQGPAYPTRYTSGSELLQGTGVYLVADCLHVS